MADRFDVVGVVLVLFGIVALSIPVYLLNGWALSWLWYWFVVPFGLPALSLPHAIGLGGLIAFLTFHRIPMKGEKTNNVELVVMMFIRPLLVVGIGWIVQRYM